MRIPVSLPHTWLAGFCLAASSLVAQQPAAPPSPGPGSAPSSAISADRAAKDGSVWGALVYASNTGQPQGDEQPTPEFPDLKKRLARAFPYKNFQLLGQHNQVVFREYESWVVPSRDVFLKLDSKGLAPDGSLNLHVQFWQGQQVLVKTDTLLVPDSPLFIAGPRWRDGQIIFVLELQKTGK